MARNNPNVGKLLAAMKKMIREVNDREICRRLEILMNAEKDDLAPPLIKKILDDTEILDPREVPEPYTQYVKHLLYMKKREKRDQAREREEDVASGEDEVGTRTTKKKTTARAGKTASRKTATKKKVAKTGKSS